MDQTYTNLGAAILQTPIKTWIILAVILFFGITSLKKQVVYPPKLLVIPAFLMYFKFPIFFHRAPYLYISMLAVGLIIGVVTTSKLKVTWQKFPKRLILPGSSSTLWILGTFFCIKYGYGLLLKMNPDQAASWAWLDTAISGLLPGYTWAKGLFFCYQYFYSHPNYKPKV